MSHPRIIEPRTTYSVTRRCFQQRWLLKPGNPILNLIVEFLLAAIAFNYDIQLHGWAFMSNHFHLVLTDPKGKLPLFMQVFDRELTRAVNASLNRKDSLWESKPYTAERIDDEDDLINKLSYIACNPVAAAVVSHPQKWIGALSLPDDYRKGARTVRPPQNGLTGSGRKSSFGDEATLELTLPPAFEDKREEFLLRYETALNARLTELRQEIKSFAGVSSLRGIDPDSIPRKAKRRATYELQPTLANSTKETRLDLQLWREAYKAALLQWKTDKTVVFPPGTYKMRVLHNANVAGSLADDG